MNLKTVLATMSLAATAFGFSGMATAQTAGTAAVGTVTTSQGQVLLVRNGLTYSAPLNTPVLAGDRFITNGVSNARIRMLDGCDRVLPEMSKARIGINCDAAFNATPATRGEIISALRNAASYPAGVTPPPGTYVPGMVTYTPSGGFAGGTVGGAATGAATTTSLLALGGSLAVIAAVAVTESDDDEPNRPVSP